MFPTTVEEREYMTRISYASAIGSLMYAMVCTRPDLSQAVSMVSRDMHDPDRSHWEAAKWILRVHERYHKHWFGIQEECYR